MLGPVRLHGSGDDPHRNCNLSLAMHSEDFSF